MIAIPAVDLREGSCVQLVGGEYAAERVRLDDPVAIAAAWQDLGFDALHVVDLDAATGRGDNAPIVQEIVSALRIPVQAGGGVRDEAAIERLLAMGMARVVVGTRALEEPDWLDRMAVRFAGRLVVAADVRDRTVLTRGWSLALGEPLPELLARLSVLPLAGVLVTAVHQEGRLAGPDLPLTREAAASVGHPLYASGGITTLADLHALRTAGASGAVIGMALYTGTLDPRQAALDFGGATRSIT